MRKLCICFLVASLACGRTDICTTDVPVDPSTYDPAEYPDVSAVTGLRGLYTSPDDLQAPDGALTVAQNVALYRPGIVEPRRGEAWLSYTSVGGTIDALEEFQGYPVAHYGSTIKYWNGSSWTAYSGSYSPRSGKPARFFQSAGSLFFLSSVGVYELDSITGTWRLTGSPQGLQGSAALRRSTSETGFATANGQWAYRLVWGYNNANNKLQLGAPSGRFILTSPATFSATTGNVAKLNTSSTVTVTSTTHGLATGEYIDVTLGGSETWFAAGRFQVTVVSSTSFTYSDAVTNSSGGTVNPGAAITYGFTSRNATLTVPIPSGITTSYFLQVYRSAKSADANSEPSDSLAIVYEKSPTNLEIAAGSMTVTDLCPDEVRGPALYTSLLEEPHNQPPACTDAAVFREGILYACTKQLQALEIQIIGVGGATGFQVGDNLTFSDRPDSIISRTYVFSMAADTTETVSTGHFKVFTDGSVAQNIANTAKSIVTVLNGWSSNSALYAEYASSDTDAPGRIRIYARSQSAGVFTVFCNAPSSLISAGAVVPQLPTTRGVVDMARSGTTVTVNTNGTHGYSTGQTVELYGSTDTGHFPDGVKTITVTGASAFTYTEAGTAVVAEANGGLFASQPFVDVMSVGTDVANSVMWAPPDEPWNVPAINYKTIGPSFGTVLSLVTARDRVLVYTDAGLYFGTGDGSSWTFGEFDTTLKLKAPRTAVAASGKAYGLFDQGFSEMVESARVTSLPIDKTLRDLLANASSAVSTYAFAVPYDSYRMVLLFLPNSSGDTAAKSVYVLHTDTGDWTGPWDLSGFGSAGPVAGAGMVSPTDDKLYISSGGYVAKEKKAMTAADQAEALVPGTLADTINGAPAGNVVTLTGTTITGLGDGILGATLLDSTSGASSTISAYSASAKTVTLASATSFSSGDTVTLVSGPITSAVQPVALTEGDAGAQKVFAEGSLAFRNSQFTSGSLTFATDLSPTFSAATTLAPPGGSSANPTEIDFWVPKSWQRGTRLSFKFSHGAVGETYGLQGWTIRSRICSRRTTR